uniref:CP n=1 Tax=Ferula potexvirus 1 TaxID=2794414 RepID=A0A7T5UEW1_9VIRU|nr:CP [Ferula potexvirus 1]
MAFVPTDPFSAPKPADLKGKYKAVSNSIATREQITLIVEKLKTATINVEQVAVGFWDIARHCADVGSTSTVRLTGICEPLKEERQLIAGFIRSVCTLRQFCMFYSKIIWNMMLEDKLPPANWQRLGYKEEAKFAAFDFFTGVTHTAALEPAGGLIRQPSPDEIHAHSANAQVAMYRKSIADNNKVTNAVELTKATSGPKIQLIAGPN